MQNQGVLTVKPKKWIEACTKDLHHLSESSAATLLGNCSCVIHLKDDNARKGKETGFNNSVLGKPGAGMSFSYQQDQIDG